MPVSFSPFLPFWAFENTAGNGDIFLKKKCRQKSALF
jgi:hypothetical protein